MRLEPLMCYGCCGGVLQCILSPLLIVLCRYWWCAVDAICHCSNTVRSLLVRCWVSLSLVGLGVVAGGHLVVIVVGVVVVV